MQRIILSLINIVSFLVVTAQAGVPEKVTVVGEYRKTEQSIVFIKASAGIVKVPLSSMQKKGPYLNGSTVTAKVNVEDFLRLN